VPTTPPVTSAPPTTPVATTPAPNPTPTPPPQPALSRQDTPAGAESFARYWLATLDYATASGDTSILRRLADCAGCNALADGIDQLHKDGGKTRGGEIRVTKAATASHVAGKAALVDLTYSRAARVVESASGTKESVPPEDNVRLLLTMSRSSTWLMTNAQPAT